MKKVDCLSVMDLDIVILTKVKQFVSPKGHKILYLFLRPVLNKKCNELLITNYLTLLITQQQKQLANFSHYIYFCYWLAGCPCLAASLCFEGALSVTVSS